MAFLLSIVRTGEQKRDLSISVVNLTKTLDTFNSERKIMTKFGCFDRFITITGQFHDSVIVFLMVDDETFEAIGVKQSCVLVPTLCLIPSVKVRQTSRLTTRLTGRQEPKHDSV